MQFQLDKINLMVRKNENSLQSSPKKTQAKIANKAVIS
jgi:hypothetical protein